MQARVPQRRDCGVTGVAARGVTAAEDASSEGDGGRAEAYHGHTSGCHTACSPAKRARHARHARHACHAHRRETPWHLWGSGVA